MGLSRAPAAATGVCTGNRIRSRVDRSQVTADSIAVRTVTAAWVIPEPNTKEVHTRGPAVARAPDVAPEPAAEQEEAPRVRAVPAELAVFLGQVPVGRALVARVPAEEALVGRAAVGPDCCLKRGLRRSRIAPPR